MAIGTRKERRYFLPSRERRRVSMPRFCMSDVAPSANADMGVSKRSARKYASYVFWIMFSINLLNYLDRYVFTVAANTVIKELGLRIDHVGYIATSFSL